MQRKDITTRLARAAAKRSLAKLAPPSARSARWALTLIIALLTTATAWATTTSTITVGGTDYTLFTGFTATGGNGTNYAKLVDGNTSSDWSATKNYDEPERYAALIRALNDNIDYTRRHAMHRKQKSDEPQPDGGDKE